MSKVICLYPLFLPPCPRRNCFDLLFIILQNWCETSHVSERNTSEGCDMAICYFSFATIKTNYTFFIPSPHLFRCSKTKNNRVFSQTRFRTTASLSCTQNHHSCTLLNPCGAKTVRKRVCENTLMRPMVVQLCGPDGRR